MCIKLGKYSFVTVFMRFIMPKEIGIVHGFFVGNHSKMLCSYHSNWSRKGQLAVIRKNIRLDIRT